GVQYAPCARSGAPPSKPSRLTRRASPWKCWSPSWDWPSSCACRRTKTPSAPPRACSRRCAARPRTSAAAAVGVEVDVRDALAHGLGISPEQIVVGNGADELITLIALAAFDPGDEVA